MRRRTRRIVLLAAALCTLVLLAACGPVLAPAPPIPSSPAADDIVARTNYLRSFGPVQALGVDGAMQAHAQFHADRLANGVSNCSGSLWHSPELGAWYAGVSAAENVACVPGCPNDGGTAFNMWWNSPPHQANMMRANYAYIGVATSCNGSVQMVVAQYRSP